MTVATEEGIASKQYRLDQKENVRPLRTMPKLLSGPFTTFQLKSFIQPNWRVTRNSRPPPNWLMNSDFAPRFSVRADKVGGVLSTISTSRSPPLKMPPAP